MSPSPHCPLQTKLFSLEAHVILLVSHLFEGLPGDRHCSRNLSGVSQLKTPALTGYFSVGMSYVMQYMLWEGEEVGWGGGSRSLAVGGRFG